MRCASRCEMQTWGRAACRRSRSSRRKLQPAAERPVRFASFAPTKSLPGPSSSPHVADGGTRNVLCVANILLVVKQPLSLYTSKTFEEPFAPRSAGCERRQARSTVSFARMLFGVHITRSAACIGMQAVLLNAIRAGVAHAKRSRSRAFLGFSVRRFAARELPRERDKPRF